MHDNPLGHLAQTLSTSTSKKRSAITYLVAVALIRTTLAIIQLLLQTHVSATGFGALCSKTWKSAPLGKL